MGAPVYPAAMSTLAQPMMPPGRWKAAKVTAGVLCFVAVVLVVASSFLPLYSGELSFGSQSVEVTINPWQAEYSGAAGGSPADVPTVGYPLVFAAVFLACAAAACWYAATPLTRPIAGRVAALATGIAGAFLIGTAWTTALLVTNGVDYVILLGTLDSGLETDATYLVGYWLLLTASLLAFTAAILSMLPARRPAWRPPYALPYGVQGQPVMPYGPAPFGMPAGPVSPPAGMAIGRPGALDHPTSQPMPYVMAVDPLTGQPMNSPVIDGPQFTFGGVDPLTGRPVAPDQSMPLTPDHGTTVAGPQNGEAPTVHQQARSEPPPAAVEQAPIVLPDPAPAPETPPGPAIPKDDDPLAEPPR